MRRASAQHAAAPAVPRPNPEPTLYVAESAAAYAHRPRLVIDASVVAAVLFRESTHERAATLLQARVLIAPHLLDYEIASVALEKYARRMLSADAVATAMDVFAALSIERHAIAADEVFALAQRYSLTAYDASYLWLAEHVEAPLATFDARLAAAAALHLEGDDTA